MNTLVIVLVAGVCLAAGYLFYGRWLAKTWGIDPNAKTPAVTKEDGQDYVFGYEDISETETILTYEPTGSEVKLTYVDQTALADANVDDYMIYAGMDEEGNQLTFVFDTENTALAINQKKPDGTSETLAGTFEETEGEDSTTLHFTSEAGAESDIVLAPVDGSVKELDITVEGETLRVSMVDTAVLQAE